MAHSWYVIITWIVVEKCYLLIGYKCIHKWIVIICWCTMLFNGRQLWIENQPSEFDAFWMKPRVPNNAFFQNFRDSKATILSFCLYEGKLYKLHPLVAFYCLFPLTDSRYYALAYVSIWRIYGGQISCWWLSPSDMPIQACFSLFCAHRCIELRYAILIVII